MADSLTLLAPSQWRIALEGWHLLVSFERNAHRYWRKIF